MLNVEVLAKVRYQDDAILAKTRSDGNVSARSTQLASCSSEGSAVATPRLSARRPGCAQPARGAA
ncbi:MAG: hypothetical protein ACK501_16850 [Planctomycetota bacterium]|jgi:hypothetical protein